MTDKRSSGFVLPALSAAATVALITWLHRDAFDLARLCYRGVLINEYWHVGASLAEGKGYSSPFGMESGPTAWTPPLLTWICAALFALTSTQTMAFVLGGVVKTLGYALTAWIWTDLMARRLGRKAAGAFVVLWLAWLVPSQRLHLLGELNDPWGIGLILAFTLWSFDRLMRARDGRGWIALAFGLGPLFGPVPVATQLGLLGVRVFACVRRRRSLWWRVGVRPLIPALVLMGCVGGAWVLRCRIELGAWVPIKSNGSYEAWQAQSGTEDGVPSYSTFFGHPYLSDAEAAKFVREGEVPYVRRHGEDFARSLHGDPVGFFGRVVNRALNAFVYLSVPTDVVLVEDRRDIRALVPALHEAGLARRFYGDGDWFWIEVDQSPERWWASLQGVRGLAEKDRLLLFGAWVREHDRLMAERESVSERARALGMAGIPALAGILILFQERKTKRRRLTPWVLAYFGYLLPYVLISHYERYQAPLAGLQVAMAVGVFQGLRLRLEPRSEAGRISGAQSRWLSLARSLAPGRRRGVRACNHE